MLGAHSPSVSLRLQRWLLSAAILRRGRLKRRARQRLPPSLSFSIPEQGSLITRLTAAIQQFVNDFGKSAPPLRPGDTGEFQFLLKDESLLARLKREVSTAALDFKRDPRAFIAETLRGEGSNRRR